MYCKNAPEETQNGAVGLFFGLLCNSVLELARFKLLTLFYLVVYEDTNIK